MISWCKSRGIFSGVAEVILVTIAAEGGMEEFRKYFFKEIAGTRTLEYIFEKILEGNLEKNCKLILGGISGAEIQAIPNEFLCRNWRNTLNH